MATKAGRVDELFNIQAITQQLNVAKKGLTDVLDLIEKIAEKSKGVGALYNSSKSINETTAAQKEQNLVYNEALKVQKQRQQIEAKMVLAEGEAVKQLEKEKAALKAKNDAIRDEIKLQNSAKDSINGMGKAVKDLTTEYNKLSKEQRNSPMGKELKGNIAALNKEIRDQKLALNDTTKNVGNYGSVWDKVKTGFIAATGAIAAASGAIKVVKDVINSTDASSERFEQTVTGLKFAWDALTRSVANGDWSNMLSNMAEANRRGKEYAATLQELSERQAALGYVEAQTLNKVIDLKLIAKNKGLDESTRAKAAGEALALEKKLMADKVRLAQEEADNLLKNIELTTGLGKATIIRYVQEREANTTLIRQANEYLDAKEKVAQLEGTIGRGGVIDQGAVKMLSEAKAVVAQASSEVRIYAEQIVAKFGKGSSDAVEAAAAALTKVETAESDVKQGTIRLTSEYTGLLEKMKDGTEAAANKAAAAFAKVKQKIDELRASAAIPSTAGFDETMGQMTGNPAITPMQNGGQYQPRESATFSTVQTDTGVKPGITLAPQAEQEELSWQTSVEIAEKYIGELGNLVNQYYAGRFQQMDYEQQKDEENKERELELAGSNVRRKNEIEREYAQKQKERDKERRKLEIQQAKFNKTYGIITATINTFLGVTKALVDPGGILGIVIAALNLATGLASIAMIASQPVPSYKTGRKGGPAEVARISEAGAEAVVMPSGEAYIAPHETLAYLPQGASVMTHQELKDLAMRMPAESLPMLPDMYDFQGSVISRGMSRGFELMASAMRGKHETHWNVSRDGITAMHRFGETWNKYLREEINF